MPLERLVSPMPTPADRNSAIIQVAEGLSWLILHHATAAAVEQGKPDGEVSTDFARQHIECTEKLRAIRTNFEMAITGLRTYNSSRTPEPTL